MQNNCYLNGRIYKWAKSRPFSKFVFSCMSGIVLCIFHHVLIWMYQLFCLYAAYCLLLSVFTCWTSRWIISQNNFISCACFDVEETFLWWGRNVLSRWSLWMSIKYLFDAPFIPFPSCRQTLSDAIESVTPIGSHRYFEC